MAENWPNLALQSTDQPLRGFASAELCHWPPIEAENMLESRQAQ
jgi:hypothetical protein